MEKPAVVEEKLVLVKKDAVLGTRAGDLVTAICSEPVICIGFTTSGFFFRKSVKEKQKVVY